MTARRRRRELQGVFIASLMGTAGCMAGIATTVAEPIPLTRASDVAVLAIMPGIVDPGSEWLRPHAMDRLVVELEEQLPGTRIVPPDESGRRLAERGLAQEYASILHDFEEAGVVDPDRVDAIASAVGATHFLTTRTGYQDERLERTTTNLDGTPLVYRTKRQELYLVARLWEPVQYAPSWEAVVESRSQAGFWSSDREPIEVVDALIDRLAEQLVTSVDVASTLGGAGAR